MRRAARVLGDRTQGHKRSYTAQIKAGLKLWPSLHDDIHVLSLADHITGPVRGQQSSLRVSGRRVHAWNREGVSDVIPTGYNTIYNMIKRRGKTKTVGEGDMQRPNTVGNVINSGV